MRSRARLVALLLASACVGDIRSFSTDAGGGWPAPAPQLPMPAAETRGLPCEVAALFAARCASCHGAPLYGGAPMPLLTREDLLAPSTSSPATNLAQRSFSRMEAGTMPPPPQAASPAEIALLQQWLADGMPGGACALAPDAGGELPPSATRASTAVIAQRLERLFPGFDGHRLTAGTGVGASLGQADQFDRFHAWRATDALALRGARDLALELCSNPDPVFDETGLWRPGEAALPASDARVAWVAARRIWGAPLPASDPAVLELAALATALRADGANDLEVRRATCVAALLAPQFWLGLDLPDDRLARIAVRLAGRSPTLDEWERWRSGTLDVRAFVEGLQRETGYATTVVDWHRTWLGPKDLARIWRGEDPRGHKYHYAWWGTTLLGGQGAVLQAAPDGGTWRLRLDAQNPPTVGFTDADLCDPSMTEQAFDPETVALWYQQKNPAAAGAWQTVAGWARSGSTWAPQAGAITLADGGTLSTTLADLSFATPVSGTTSFGYAAGRLRDTPLATFREGDVRWQRIAPTGPQNGWSRVRTWYSNQEVRVCNGLARFLVTCAYQPQQPAQGGPPAFGGTYPYWDGAAATFDATRPAIVLQSIDLATVHVSSLAHPTILESFRCGVPEPDAPGPFSKGPPFNDLAASVRLSPRALRPDQTVVPEAVASTVPELAAMQRIATDVNGEPEALVRQILAERLDYRTLLTADWTTVSGPTELSYRTQLYFVPRRPEPLDLTLTPRRLSLGTTGLSSGWLQNPTVGSTLWGPTPWGDQRADLSSPRPMAGILTQAAFLAPAGYKVRSVAARILRVLTCSDVSAWQPGPAAAALHTPFIPHSEPTAASHLDPAAGCYTCHVNLDPLAAALSSGFLESRTENGRTSQRLAAGGELSYYAHSDLLDTMSYGLRGTSRPSEGALFGQRVRGVREVARVLADSRPFARCAVRHAFEGVFGRLPQGGREQALVDSTTDRFMSTHAYDYDAMVRDLVLSPELGVAP